MRLSSSAHNDVSSQFLYDNGNFSRRKTSKATQSIEEWMVGWRFRRDWMTVATSSSTEVADIMARWRFRICCNPGLQRQKREYVVRNASMERKQHTVTINSDNRIGRRIFWRDWRRCKMAWLTTMQNAFLPARERGKTERQKNKRQTAGKPIKNTFQRD